MADSLAPSTRWPAESENSPAASGLDGATDQKLPVLAYSLLNRAIRLVNFTQTAPEHEPAA
jgi:hypothetical protein